MRGDVYLHSCLFGMQYNVLEVLYMKQWYIAIAVAIVYLAVSLTFHAWSWSWIIWVIYAIYRLLDNKKNKAE